MNKSIFKNFIFNTIYSMVNILYPLITLTYISRTVYADGVGRFSFCLSIVTIFLSIAQLGIPKYGIREIAKNQNSIERYSQTFWEIIVINAISTSVTILIYIICVFNINRLMQYKNLFLILLLLLIFNYFSVDWLFAGIEDFQYITIRSVCIKIISLILVVFCVRGPEDVWIYALLYCICLGGNNIINIVYLGNKIVKPVQRLNLKQHFKSIIILLAMNIAVDLYSQLDTTMLGIFSDESSVGYYTNPMKFVRVIVTVVISLGTVLLPRLSMLYNEKKFDEVKFYIEKIWKLVVFVSLPLVFGIIVCSQELVVVFLGDTFGPSKKTLVILALLIPILAIGNILSFELITFHKEKNILYAVSCGAIINLILNYFLIIKYSQNGAAFASVVSELVVVFVKMYYVNREMRFDFCIKQFIQSLFINLIMVGVCLLIGNFFLAECSDIIRLVVKVCAGFGTFVVLSFVIFKDENAKWLLKYLLKKIKR